MGLTWFLAGGWWFYIGQTGSNVIKFYGKKILRSALICYT